MSDRYFVAEPISPGRLVLTGPEAHHLIHVMRAAPGANVVLFDGSGAEFPAVVEQVRRNEVDLAVAARKEVNRELPIEVNLGVALPKGDRQKWLVEKATELGVSRIVPLLTQRSVAQPVEQALVRLRRAVVEASKQCGRNRLMQIDRPRSWPDFLERAAGSPCRLLAQPGIVEAGDHPIPLERPEQLCPPGETAFLFGPGPVFLAVGPEGGFSDQEVAAAIAAGWRTVDLGPRILRVETAALLLAATVAQRWTQ